MELPETKSHASGGDEDREDHEPEGAAAHEGVGRRSGTTKATPGTRERRTGSADVPLAATVSLEPARERLTLVHREALQELCHPKRSACPEERQRRREESRSSRVEVAVIPSRQARNRDPPGRGLARDDLPSRAGIQNGGVVLHERHERACCSCGRPLALDGCPLCRDDCDPSPVGSG